MVQLSDFQRDTGLEPVDHGTFEADLGKTWWVDRGPNGGYLAAILTRAMQEVAEAVPPLRSLSVRYLRAAQAGKAEVASRVEHAGRSISTLSARMTQADQPVALAQATVGRPRQGPRLSRLSPPEALAWDQALELPRDGPVTPPTFTQHVEYRIAGGGVPLGGAEEAEMQVWMRMADPSPWEDALVCFLADAWMPATFAALDAPAAIPTVDLTVHATGHRPEDPTTPVLAVFTADHGADGYVVEDGQLWTPEGELVARARQLRRILGHGSETGGHA